MSLDQAIYWITNDGWAVGVLILFLAVSCLVVYFTARGHHRELAEARAGYNVDCFVRELTAKGCDAYVARLVYRYIEDMHRIDFPILPSDDICVTLGLTEDALLRALPALLSVSGRVPTVSSRA